MNLKKIGKLFTSTFVGTGPSSFKKRIYRAAVSRRLRNTVIAEREGFTSLIPQPTIRQDSKPISVNARHPDVLLKTIKIYKYRQNTTKFIILYHFWTTCFDSLESLSGPLVN